MAGPAGQVKEPWSIPGLFHLYPYVAEIQQNFGQNENYSYLCDPYVV